MEEKKKAMEENNKERLNNYLILNSVAGPHTLHGWSCSKGRGEVATIL
jgi:hypothetical protein